MKTKTEGGSESVVVSKFDGSPVSSAANTTNTITYEEGPAHLRDGATNWKACNHYWALNPNRGFVSGRVWNSQDSRPPYGAVWYLPGNTQYFQQKAQSATSRLKPKTDSEMLHEATYVMEGRLNQTLLPITDLIQLVRKVDGLGSGDALLTSLLAPFRTKPKNLSELIKKAAGADLARKFGVQTLWKTMTDALKQGAVVDNHLRRLERIQNSQQRNFKVSVLDRWSGESGTADFGGSPWGHVLVRADYQVGSLAETSIHFRTSVRYDTSDALRTRLVWDSLGLSNIFSTAWDLMPLSFVVDWFVKVQEFANRLDSYYFHTVPLERMTELQDVWVTSTVKGFVKFNNFTARPRYQFRASIDDSSVEINLETGRFVRHPVNCGTTNAWLPSLRVGGSNLTLAQNLTGLELLVQRTF